MDSEEENKSQKLQDEKRKRSSNVTEEQKMLLLQYMEKNLRLMSGKFASDFTFKDAMNSWKKLTEILNSCNGVNKDWKSWRKVNIYFPNLI